VANEADGTSPVSRSSAAFPLALFLATVAVVAQVPLSKERGIMTFGNPQLRILDVIISAG
jgi:hypothetical protein